MRILTDVNYTAFCTQTVAWTCKKPDHSLKFSETILHLFLTINLNFSETTSAFCFPGWIYLLEIRFLECHLLLPWLGFLNFSLRAAVSRGVPLDTTPSVLVLYRGTLCLKFSLGQSFWNQEEMSLLCYVGIILLNTLIKNYLRGSSGTLYLRD